MKFQKILALLIAAQMLLFSAAACSQTDEKDTQDTVDTASTGESESESESETVKEEEENARTSIADNLPEMNFDGKDFRIMTMPNQDYQFYVEESTGDAENDAVYNRNVRVEDRFNVSVKAVVIEDGLPYEVIDKYITAGLDEAEIVEQWQYTANIPISKGNYLNWKDMPYINLDQPWWNKASNDAATINGKLFCITGDLSISSMTYTFAQFFNMDLMENWGYSSDYLYGLVKDGEWTLDKMIEICSNIYADNDGNGEKNMGDTFGYGYSRYAGTDAWVTAMGEKILDKNEDGQLVIGMATEKVYSALEKLLNFIYATNGVFTYVNTDEENRCLNEFVAGNVAIVTLTFDNCYSNLRDMKDAYGVLPYPKYDTAQEGYYTIPSDRFGVFGIPKSVSSDNYEFIGVIMEALTAETYKTVYPVYYDAALKGRYSEDQTTAETIDLIMAGRVYEFAFQFGTYLFDLPYLFRNALYTNDSALASTITKKTTAIEKKLVKIYGFYEDAE